MKLEEVWDYFDSDLKKAFYLASKESSRIRTKLILGALIQLPPSTAGVPVLKSIEEEAGIELIHPEHPEIDGTLECPDPVTFSPCVKEALNFFRIHQISGITPAHYALRLLQIGSGSTIRELEKKGILRELQQKLSKEVEKER